MIQAKAARFFWKLGDFKEMHTTRPTSLISATAALFMITMLLGCKSAPPSSNPAAQTPATPAGTTAGTSATPTGNATEATVTAGGTPSTSAYASQPVAKAPPKPQPVTLTVPRGRDVHVRITETINAKTADVGDSFSGVLSAPLTTKSGETVFAKGTNVSGTVVSAKGQGRFKGAGVLAIDLKQVGGHSVSAVEYVVSKKGKGKRTAALIGGGAGGGALIGALAGGGKGALIGGLIGSGAGTAGSGLTGNKALVIHSESIIYFELSQPISITVRK
jgi:hypothetical protein